MTTVRLSSEAVQVQSFVYAFTNSEAADQFQTCLLFDPLDDCETKFSRTLGIQFASRSMIFGVVVSERI